MKSRCIMAAIAVLVFQLAATPVFSRDEDEGRRKNSLEEGAWAIQFQIEENIGLKAFNDMIISLKRHLSSSSALRFGVNFDLSFDDSDVDRTNTMADTVTFNFEDASERNSQSFQVDLMYLAYRNPGAAVNFFWGVGPLVRYSRSRREITLRIGSPTNPGLQHSELYQRSWRMGVIGSAGAEWFITKTISLHAEYRATGSYGRAKSESVSRDDDGEVNYYTTNTDSWAFDGVNVIFGMSLYF